MNKQQWLSKCLSWKEKWPVFQEQGKKLEDDKNGINLYKFYQILNNNLKKDSVVCWDAGSSLYCSNQALRLNGEQRSIGSLAQAEMGCCISLSAGVSFAKNKGEVICCIGDGSFNTNPQALAIIKQHNLPVKIFVLNNQGYLSIKNSQDKFYEGRRIGTDSKDGIFFPKIEDIAKSYEIDYCLCSNIKELQFAFNYSLYQNFPVITEIICQEIQDINPSIVGKKKEDGKIEQCDFSDMYPHLNPEELKKEMINE